MFHAQCHCGNVHLQTEIAPTSVTECNCSICHRYGARWAYFEVSDVTVITTQPTVTYRHGDKTIDFHHCSTCGCLTHYSTTEHCDAADTRIAINTRMCPTELTESLPIRHFDGAVSYTFLD
jgi:hypothetical protein